MSTKRLHVESVTNELQGASKYFEKPNIRDTKTPAAPAKPANLGKSRSRLYEDKPQDTTLPNQAHNLKKQSAEEDSMQASMLAGAQDNMILDIRKSVKEVGKEALFLRLTPEEKDQLKDVVYSLSKQRPQISDNEVGRIALNYLLEDYKASGKNSILIKVIEALNA